VKQNVEYSLIEFHLIFKHLLCLINFVGIRVIFEGIVNKTNNVIINVILRLVFLTHFCSRIEVSVTYSECVSFALVTQRAMRMRHIFMCGLPGSTSFVHLTSYTVKYSGKKNIFNTK